MYYCSIYLWDVRLEKWDLLLSCPTFWLGCRYMQHLHIVYHTLPADHFQVHSSYMFINCSILLSFHHFIISSFHHGAGWKGVKDTLAGLAQQHGVQIKTNVSVEEVIVSGGRAVGVKLQGGVEENLGAKFLVQLVGWVEWYDREYQQNIACHGEMEWLEIAHLKCKANQ